MVVSMLLSQSVFWVILGGEVEPDIIAHLQIDHGDGRGGNGCSIGSSKAEHSG